MNFVKFLRTRFFYRTPPEAAPDPEQIAILIVEVSLLHILYEFHEIKLNVMKHILNCVS